MLRHCRPRSLGRHTSHTLGSHRVQRPGSQCQLGSAAAAGAATPAAPAAAAMAVGQVIPPGQAPPPHALAVKTMLLVRADGAAAGGPPVVVVLLAGQRVDLRAVSQHLQCGSGRLRLATPAEAEAATGCALGCIAPVSNVRQLQTLVDAHIAACSPDQLLCAGAGVPGTQMLLSVAELLSASAAAQVGSFSTQQLAPQQQQQQQQLPEQQSGQDAESGQQLPEPWPAGAELVQLVGVLAQRRRIAKLLLFASLVPEPVPVLPTGNYVRRLWRCPDTGRPCEVQLICGKTLERALGREAAAALFDRLRVGSVVALTGRVQQNPAAAAPGKDSAVLDVVVSDIRVLSKSRDALSRALKSAQREGHTAASTALQLEQLQACSRGKDVGSRPTAAAAAANVPASGQPGQQQQQPQQQPRQQECYQSPLTPDCIVLVQDLQGIARMQEALLGAVPPPCASDGSSDAGDPPAQVVAIDSEWRPHEKGSPRRNPVALLQLATREHAFLVDMLALCRQQPGEEAGAEGAESSSSVVRPPPGALTGEEAALAGFLQQLFADRGIVKLGWQVGGDLKRLADSYPQLLPVSSDGSPPGAPGWDVQPLVDLQQLVAPAANPRKFQPSLSSVVRRVCGLPLDKSQQTSDWGARPLTLAQQQYAALDAHVLTDLYDRLQQQRV